MTNQDILPVITAFGGIILGAVVSFFPPFILERIKRKDEIKAVTCAVTTEVETTIFLIEKRRYIDHIQSILLALRDGRLKSSTFQVIVPNDYCPIYKSHLSQVGLLPDAIRGDVVAFYQLIEAAIADVRPGGMLAENECGEDAFQQLLDIVQQARTIGLRIIQNTK
jgi:hypothetical protein